MIIGRFLIVPHLDGLKMIGTRRLLCQIIDQVPGSLARGIDERLQNRHESITARRIWSEYIDVRYGIDDVRSRGNMP